jgi:hypothetical protein
MFLRRFAPALPALLLLAPLCRSADTDRLSPIDRRYYHAIKPAAGEVRWQQIPWVQDLAEAVGQAKKEKRPLFVWVAGDEPLGRC